MIRLQTERLVLRPPEEGDFEAYAALCADAEVMRFLGGRPWTRRESWRHLAYLSGHWSLRGYGQWMMVPKSGGATIGRVGFIDSEGHPGFEIAWALSRASWGQGYASEGATRALQFAFSQLRRDHVISLIDPANEPSRKLAERLGERYERTLEHEGQSLDLMGIRRADWIASMGRGD